MIPRAHLFGDPATASVSISPDGRWLAWASSAAGVRNLWVAPRDRVEAAQQVTFDTRRGVSGHSWTRDSAYILFSQDVDGDENFQLYAVNVATRTQRCLTPFPKTRTAIVRISPRLPGSILVSLNKRDARYADLFRLDVASGELALVLENPGFAGFIVDDDYGVRFAVGTTPEGGRQLLQRGTEGQWQVCSVAVPDDARTTGWSHLDVEGKTLYSFDSRGQDTAALLATDLASGEVTVLGTSMLADVSGMLTDGLTYRPLAYWINYERPTVCVLSDAARDDVAFLESLDLGNWSITSRTADDRTWLIGAASDTQPGRTHVYDRDRHLFKTLFHHRPQLEGVPLARMQSTVVTSRDGLRLVCYLTLPREFDTGEPLRSSSPAPMVLLVHGGPWSRDGFGFNPMHQWLADRGYAVLSVNFRSSTGYGKAFLNAGDSQWGRRMDDDLEDAVQWAVDAGLADPQRLAIVGGSYGGYAVLCALTRRPGRYACGVDVVGPSNLETLLKAIPPHWEHERQMLYRAVGNPTTEAGVAELRSKSPLHAAGAIVDPLMIAQGANDPRVRQSESDQMVDELVTRGIAVTYVLFPDEGHGFSREPNRLIFNAAMEAFLARHLGGRFEPFKSVDFPGNTMQVLQGELPIST